MAPRDYPIAAGDDPAYATTAAEERIPEGVLDRAAREEPDVGAAELGVGGGMAGADPDTAATVDDESAAELREDEEAGLALPADNAPAGAAAEAARRRSASLDDPRIGVPGALASGELVEPGGDAEERPTLDDEATLVVSLAEDDEAAASPEEAAIQGAR